MMNYNEFRKVFENCYNENYSTEPKENFLECGDGYITLIGSDEEMLTLTFNENGELNGWE